MRNAVQRRNHKERAQPAQREKWGILEKHKDYSLRAKDYNEKKKRLKILRGKAAERNPDEFSYGMLSSKTDRYGRKIQDRGNPTLSHDAVKLLKTQDAGYLKTLIQQTRRKRQRMEQEYLLSHDKNVPLLEEVRDNQHVKFVASREEQHLVDDAQSKQDTSSSTEQSTLQWLVPCSNTNNQPESLHIERKDPRQLARQQEEGILALKEERAARKLRKRRGEIRQSRLSALRTRERDLLAAEQQLGHQRARMGSSIGGVNQKGVKWKIRERKR
ncbi:MAG: hypothetical protein L6R37_003968 [Teloschistes peruensis]|nr:MAG: hypothetical protein L6R37_003968 [Teloschistes peruensis]